MSAFALSNIFLIISCGFMGILLVVKGKTSYAKFFGLFCFCIIIWGIGCLNASTNNADAAYWWLKFAWVSVIFTPVIFLHFVYLFLNYKKRFFLILCYLLGCLYLVLLIIYPRLIIPAIKLISGEFYFHYFKDNLTIYFIFFYIWFYWIMLLYAFFLLIKKYQFAVGQARIQLKYFLFSTILGWIGPELDFLTGFGFKIYPYSNFLIGIFPLIMGYAVIKHNLMDLNIVLKKTFIYSVVISFITLLYFFVIYILEHVTSTVANYHSIPIALFFIAVFSIIFIPLKNRIQHYIDKKFFKGTIDQLDSQKTLLESELQRSERLKTVSTLAAGMAHEIKNPLTSIKTFAEYLDKKHNDPKYRDKFKQIVLPEINKISSIINQLLDYSKTDKTNIKQCNVHSILDYVLALYSNQLLNNNIKVTKAYSATNNTITCDENQIKQAIINLVLNSIEAMSKGGGLTITTKNIDNTLQISIKDTGPGIPKDKLKDIFNPFYTTKEKGTGLGLFVVNQIVENNKGKILIDNSEDGTVFRVVLDIVY